MECEREEACVMKIEAAAGGTAIGAGGRPGDLSRSGEEASGGTVQDGLKGPATTRSRRSRASRQLKGQLSEQEDVQET